MRTTAILIALAACTSGPSKDDTTTIFAQTTSALSYARIQAVAKVQGQSGNVTLDASGACPAGGTYAVTGTFDDSSGNTDQTNWNLSVAFAHCADLFGQVDGNLDWTSTASAASFATAITGSVTYSGNRGTWTCDADMHLLIDATDFAADGTLCGYSLHDDLHLGK
jgi:hypothetical protein